MSMGIMEQRVGYWGRENEKSGWHEAVMIKLGF